MEKSKSYVPAKTDPDSAAIFKLHVQRQYDEQQEYNQSLQQHILALEKRLEITQGDVLSSGRLVKTMDNLSSVDKFKPDTNDATVFWDKFVLFAKYKDWNAEKTRDMFPFFLDDTCYHWYKNLQPGEKDSVDHIKTSFFKKFDNVEDNEWIISSKLGQRVQKQNESVGDYIKEIMQMCRQLNETNEHIRRKVISGLLPEIRTFVITKEPKTLEGVERCAKIAENLRVTGGNQLSADTQKIDYLTRVVESLQLSMQKNEEIIAVDGDRGRMATKMVRFREDRRTNSEDRGRMEYGGGSRSVSPANRSISPWTRGKRSSSPWRGSTQTNMRSGASPDRSYYPRVSPSRNGQQNSWSRSMAPQERCSRCGMYNCLPYACRAKNATCYYCKAMGHFERCCGKKDLFVKKGNVSSQL
ncbi:MAG: hypothetical protein ABW185_28755 [Sedimenticola sp.]